jgi:predicted ATP-grasp superfamily ATP-dependent carboligase
MENIDQIKRLLVVGVDCTALAKSAYHAGHTVFGADYFGDIDLRSVCKASLSIQEQEVGSSCGVLGSSFSPDAILTLVDHLHEEHELDGCLLASGLEDSHDTLAKLNSKVPIIGNTPETIAKVRDKLGFFKALRRLGLAHPETVFVQDVEESKRVAKDLRYPIVVKPPAGFGGLGITKVADKRNLGGPLKQMIQDNGGAFLQEFIEGLSASASFIATQKSTKVLTINEQLYGLPETGQRAEFGYCGNVVPADLGATYDRIKNICDDIVRKISLHFQLIGSNGVDIVLSKEAKPYVLEVNPRFQGTLECVERMLGINLVKAHMDACIHKTLPSPRRSLMQTFCIRLILYALNRSLTPVLQRPYIVDTPFPSVVIEAGEPLCSVILEEKSRTGVLLKSRLLAEEIYNLLEPA